MSDDIPVMNLMEMEKHKIIVSAAELSALVWLATVGASRVYAILGVKRGEPGGPEAYELQAAAAIRLQFAGPDDMICSVADRVHGTGAKVIGTAKIVNLGEGEAP